MRSLGKFFPSLGISHNLAVGLGVSDFVCWSHICFSIKSLNFSFSVLDFKVPVSASGRVSDLPFTTPTSEIRMLVSKSTRNAQFKYAQSKCKHKHNKFKKHFHFACACAKPHHVNLSNLNIHETSMNNCCAYMFQLSCAYLSCACAYKGSISEMAELLTILI